MTWIGDSWRKDLDIISCAWVPQVLCECLLLFLARLSYGTVRESCWHFPLDWRWQSIKWHLIFEARYGPKIGCCTGVTESDSSGQDWALYRTYTIMSILRSVPLPHTLVLLLPLFNYFRWLSKVRVMNNRVSLVWPWLDLHSSLKLLFKHKALLRACKHHLCCQNGVEKTWMWLNIMSSFWKLGLRRKHFTCRQDDKMKSRVSQKK